MRLLAPFAIVLLASCASSDGLIDERTLGCDSGEAISIVAGIDGGGSRELQRDQQFDLVVEVSNNSHGDVIVTAIRAEQTHHESSRYRVEGGYRKFDQVIEEGKDHTFRLPLSRVTSGRSGMSSSAVVENVFELVVSVTLSNGDTYRCPFGFR